MPPILPVRSPAHRRLEGPFTARCGGLQPQLDHSVPVFGVYDLRPAESFALSPREPRVIVPPTVEVGDGSVGRRHPNGLWRHLDQGAVTRLTFPQHVLRAPALRDVPNRAGHV